MAKAAKHPLPPVQGSVHTPSGDQGSTPSVAWPHSAADPTCRGVPWTRCSVSRRQGRRIGSDETRLYIWVVGSVPAPYRLELAPPDSGPRPCLQGVVEGGLLHEVVRLRSATSLRSVCRPGRGGCSPGTACRGPDLGLPASRTTGRPVSWGRPRLWRCGGRPWWTMPASLIRSPPMS